MANQTRDQIELRVARNQRRLKIILWGVLVAVIFAKVIGVIN